MLAYLQAFPLIQDSKNYPKISFSAGVPYLDISDVYEVGADDGTARPLVYMLAPCGFFVVM